MLSGSRLLGLLATVAAVVVSVRLGRRGPGGVGRRALTVLADAALGLFALAMLLELGTSEAAGDYYGPQYVETYAQPVSGLRSDGAEISNIRDGNEVANRYPRAQRQFDPDSGQRTPVPPPEFRPPPAPGGGSGTGP